MRTDLPRVGLKDNDAGAPPKPAARPKSAQDRPTTTATGRTSNGPAEGTGSPFPGAISMPMNDAASPASSRVVR